MSNNKGWIGVDLDGTLAEYNGWVSELHIGKPIPAMVDRIKLWLSEGKNVKIFTARVAQWDDGSKDVEKVRAIIEAWVSEHIGTALPITNVKDYLMVELWDDRAIQVIPNTGIRADGKP